MKATASSDTEKRFAFGRNWQSFLAHLDQGRIDEATRSLEMLLGVGSLRGKRFLDIGSGSGLFSLAAHRLGADVVSFDFDADSVACTERVRRDWAAGDADWKVLQGSALDAGFMDALAAFDVVYSWGVLHHTGDMATGIRLAAGRVRPGGQMVLAIYNDQGWRSRAWRIIKRFHCRGRLAAALVEMVFFPVFFVHGLVQDALRLRWPGSFIGDYSTQRGMSIVHDWRDWLGGYPFEVASPAAMTRMLAGLGFTTRQTRSTRGLGCNEFVFQHVAPADGFAAGERDASGGRDNHGQG